MPESITDRPTKAHSYVFLLSKSARYFYDADAIREPLARNWDPSKPNGRTMEPGSTRNLEAGKPTAHVQTTAAKPNPMGANARSVWMIATEPTPFAHFATFPREIARRCIASGSSEHGACAQCMTPWRRVTSVTYAPTAGGGSTGHRRDVGEPDGRLNGTSAAGKPALRKHVETTGWEPSCGCRVRGDYPGDVGGPHERVPCVVLDPFMGSGTTALVARVMGRRAIGIELSPEYLEIARERLQQLSLLA